MNGIKSKGTEVCRSWIDIIYRVRGYRLWEGEIFDSDFIIKTKRSSSQKTFETRARWPSKKLANSVIVFNFTISNIQTTCHFTPPPPNSLKHARKSVKFRLIGFETIARAAKLDKWLGNGSRRQFATRLSLHAAVSLPRESRIRPLLRTLHANVCIVSRRISTASVCKARVEGRDRKL